MIGAIINALETMYREAMSWFLSAFYFVRDVIYRTFSTGIDYAEGFITYWFGFLGGFLDSGVIWLRSAWLRLWSVIETHLGYQPTWLEGYNQSWTDFAVFVGDISWLIPIKELAVIFGGALGVRILLKLASTFWQSLPFT